jgi:hypothetical protein
MANFAASYVVFQHDSLDDPGSSSAESVGPQDGEAMDEAIAFADAARTLISLTLGCFFTGSTTGGVCVGGGLLVGLVDDERFFKKPRIVDGRTTKGGGTLLLG